MLGQNLLSPVRTQLSENASEKTAESGSRIYTAVTRVRELPGVPGSLFCTWPALVLTIIWGVNHEVSISPTLSLFFHHFALYNT